MSNWKAQFIANPTRKQRKEYRQAQVKDAERITSENPRLANLIIASFIVSLGFLSLMIWGLSQGSEKTLFVVIGAIGGTIPFVWSYRAQNKYLEATQ